MMETKKQANNLIKMLNHLSTILTWLYSKHLESSETVLLEISFLN